MRYIQSNLGGHARTPTSQQLEALLLKYLQQHGSLQLVAHLLRGSLAALVRKFYVMLQRGQAIQSLKIETVNFHTP